MKYTYLLRIAILLFLANTTRIYGQCPPPPPVNTSSYRCSPGTATLIAISETTNVTHRWYTVPSGGYPISGVVTVQTNMPSMTSYTASFSSTTTYYVSTYHPSLGCESARTPITMTISTPAISAVHVTANPAFTGSDPGGPYLQICQGTQVIFTALPTNGGTNPAYQWYSNGSAIPGQTGVTYTTSSLVNNQMISVRMTSNASCVSPTTANSFNVRMIVNPSLGTPSAITVSGGSQPTCQLTNGTTTTTYSTMATGSTGYNWSISNPSAGTINPTTGVMTWANGFYGNVIIQVTANGCGGPSTQITRSMTISQSLPVSVSIGGNTELCGGQGAVFAAIATNGGTLPQFQWKVNGSIVTNQQSQPQPNISIYLPTTALNHNDVVTCEVSSNLTCVTGSPATSNGLTISVITPLTPSVYVSTDPIITGGGGGVLNLEICQGTSVEFTAHPTNGGNPDYQWYSDGSVIPGETGETYTPSSLVNDQKISVQMKSNASCVSSLPVNSLDVRMIVNYIPSLPTVTLPYIIPYNSPATLSASGALQGTEGYKWYDQMAGGSLVSSTTSNLTVHTDYYVTRYNLSSGCESSPRVSYTVTINQYPTVNAGTDQTIEYPNSQVTLNASASDPDGTLQSYVWTQISGPSITIPNNNNASVTLFNLIAGTYVFRITVTDNNGSTASDDISVTVNPLTAGLNYNFIKETTVLETGKTESSQLDNLPVEQKNITTNYFDGLGRPMQTVVWQGSFNKKDIIQPIAYDDFGRESMKYLPYVSSANDGFYKENALLPDYPNSEQYKYYQNETNNSLNEVKDLAPFARTVFEPSPLNRVLEQGAAGAVWQPGDESGSSASHTAKIMYLANNADEVLLLEVDVDGSLGYATTGGNATNDKYYYETNMLFKVVTKDENWTNESGNLNNTEEFKDIHGNVILKRSYVLSNEESIETVETYYVYDDFGLLRYVIPPLAVSQLTLPADKNNAIIKSLCYYYEYDSRNRMVFKQLPGAEPVYMVYDTRDRLVATQNGNQRADNKNQWLFTKYDALNRPVLTGIYEPGATYNSQYLMQGLVDDYYAQGILYEERGAVVLDYTNQSFPDVSSRESYLTATYYDNYTFSEKLDFIPAYNISEYTDTEGSSNDYFDGTKGLVTGTNTKILGSSTWLPNTVYYDDHYRVIQTISKNFTGGMDYVSNKYDFVGKITKSMQVHIKTGTAESFRIVKDYQYDHAGRLTKVYHQMNSQPKVLMSWLKYNELGQLVEKNLHSSDEEVDFTQSIDYRYNIRGWLKNINNADLINDAGNTNDDSNDKFGMQLYYNQDQ